MKQTGKLGSVPIKNNKVRGFEHVADEHRQYDGEVVEGVGKIEHMVGFIPQRGTRGSAGYDIKTPIDFTLEPGGEILIWTNIKAYMQPGELLFIDIRSSVGIKKDIIFKNVLPLIDEDYYSNPKNDGNIGLCLKNTGNEIHSFKRGDAICQGIFMTYLTTDNDQPVSEERIGGIGSTDGKKA